MENLFDTRASQGEIDQQIKISHRFCKSITNKEKTRRKVNKDLKSLRVIKAVGKGKLDKQIMTGHHAGFLITRAAKRFLMNKKIKEDLLNRVQ